MSDESYKPWGNPAYSEEERKIFTDFSAKIDVLRKKGKELTVEAVNSLVEDFHKLFVPACKDNEGNFKSSAHKSAFNDMEPSVRKFVAMC